MLCAKQQNGLRHNTSWEELKLPEVLTGDEGVVAILENVDANQDNKIGMTNIGARKLLEFVRSHPQIKHVNIYNHGVSL